jgi:methionyl-tRNA formyltransferase
MRIVFFGTPAFTMPALRRLHAEGWPIAMAVTAPDMPVGRHKLLTPSPVSIAATELGIPVRTPSNLKDDAFFNEFSELHPDLCIVVAYNKILPKRYLDIPRLGFINIHPSLLPAYRGPSPIQTAILDGCASTGVSIMQLDEAMDHGPILTQDTWTIPSAVDSPAAHDELFRLGTDTLIRILPEYCNGTLIPRPQDHSQASFTRKFTREDGRLDWNHPAQRINDRIRALGTNPGSWTTWLGKTLNVFHAHPVHAPLPVAQPGTVMRHHDDIAVVTGQGILVLDIIQLEGSKRMSARDFVNGRQAFVGGQLV